MKRMTGWEGGKCEETSSTLGRWRKKKSPPWEVFFFGGKGSLGPSAEGGHGTSAGEITSSRCQPIFYRSKPWTNSGRLHLQVQAPSAPCYVLTLEFFYMYSIFPGFVFQHHAATSPHCSYRAPKAPPRLAGSGFPLAGYISQKHISIC